MSLPEIVQQGRPDDLTAVGKAFGHPARRQVPVPLIEHRLVEKRVFFPGFYPLTDAGDLGRSERFRPEAASESAD